MVARTRKDIYVLEYRIDVTVKTLNIGPPRVPVITVTVLKVEPFSFTLQSCAQEIQIERQTVQTQIRLLLKRKSVDSDQTAPKEQSDLGLHCLLRLKCPNT